MDVPTLLVVDDESVVTFMLTKKLSELGIRVVAASHGEEALRLSKQVLPFAVLTDNDMPRMTGTELAKRLYNDERTRDLPVIMLTGRGHRIAPSECSATNIQHILSKPFSAREIVHLVQEMLTRHTDRINAQPRTARPEAA
ncbi:MAG: response regulator [Phycisphaerales bacterium]|nr:response regulator [Phycisphaerales bacterium]